MYHRKVIQGSFYIFIGQVVTSCVQLFLFIFLTRTLTLREYGQYSAILAFCLIIQILFESGFTNSTARAIASGEGSSYSLARFAFLCQFFWAVGLFLVVFLGANVWAGLVFNDASLAKYLKVASLYFVPMAIFTMGYWILVGQKRFKRAGILFSSWYLLRLVLVVLFVLYRRNLGLVFFAFFVASLLGLVLTGVSISGVERIRTYIDKKRIVLRGVMVVAANFAAFSVYRMDKLFVKHILGRDDIVGSYALASNLSFITQLFSIAVVTALFSHMADSHSRHDLKLTGRHVMMGVKLLWLTLVPISMGVILLGKDIVLLVFGEKYSGAVPYLHVLIFAGMFFAFFLFFRYSLLSFDRQSTGLAISLLVFIAAVILNLILVNVLGPMGAAWTTLVCSLGGALIAGIFVFKVLKGWCNWRSLTRVLAAAAGCLVLAFLCTGFSTVMRIVAYGVLTGGYATFLLRESDISISDLFRAVNIFDKP